jgi:hypothetical protein
LPDGVPADDDGLAVPVELAAGGLVKVVAPPGEMVPLHPAITPRAVASGTQANAFRMLLFCPPVRPKPRNWYPSVSGGLAEKIFRREMGSFDT